MTTIKAFVKRHPLLSFYALAFAITWGGLIKVVGGPSEIPRQRRYSKQTSSAPEGTLLV